MGAFIVLGVCLAISALETFFYAFCPEQGQENAALKETDPLRFTPSPEYSDYSDEETPTTRAVQGPKAVVVRA